MTKYERHAAAVVSAIRNATIRRREFIYCGSPPARSLRLEYSTGTILDITPRNGKLYVTLTRHGWEFGERSEYLPVLATDLPPLVRVSLLHLAGEMCGSATSLP